MNDMMISLMQQGSLPVTKDMILEQQSTQISTMTNLAYTVSATNNKISGSTDTIMTDSPFYQKSSSLLAQVAREKVPNNTLQYKKPPGNSQVNLSSTSENSNSVNDSALSPKELRNDQNELNRGMKRYSNNISKEDNSIVDNQQNNFFDANKIKNGTKTVTK